LVVVSSGLNLYPACPVGPVDRTGVESSLPIQPGPEGCLTGACPVQYRLRSAGGGFNRGEIFTPLAPLIPQHQVSIVSHQQEVMHAVHERPQEQVETCKNLQRLAVQG